VLEYVANGLRNKEIALKLFISDDTVKKHLYNMFQKLSVKNRFGLVSKARELGLI
jgi:DNA-binding NarL/FixJ family response regulator